MVRLRCLQYCPTEGLPLKPNDRLMFHPLLTCKRQRRDKLDRKIDQLAIQPALAPVVGRPRCLRGISLHSAMVLATELFDWCRFEYPRQTAVTISRR